jgi:arabinose-5-phosphate isomerase
MWALLCCSGGQQLLGTFTDGDLRRALQRQGPAALALTLEEVMTAAPRTCRSDLKAIAAMQVP